MQSDPTYLLTIIMEGGFYILLFVFTLHAVFLGYHWFTFGASKRTSEIALLSYLTGGVFLLIILAVAVFVM